MELKYSSQEVTQLEKMKQVPINDSVEFSLEGGDGKIGIVSSEVTRKEEKKTDVSDWDATFDDI